MPTTCKFTYSEEDRRLQDSTIKTVVCHNSKFGDMLPKEGNDIWNSLATENASNIPEWQRSFLKEAEKRIDSIEHRNDLRDKPSRVNLSGRNDSSCMYCWGTTTASHEQGTTHEKDHMFWCALVGGESDVGGKEESRAENMAKHIASPVEFMGECDWNPDTGDSNCNRSVNRAFSCTL